jgi:hypothetical protein
MNALNIKWAMVVSLNEKGFNRNYKSALRNAGFSQVSFGDVFGMYYNNDSPESVERYNKAVSQLNAKLSSYKNKKGIFSFTITDKQFGQIGKVSEANQWASIQVPCQVGVIPVTYQQMYEEGCIPLPASQARENHPNKII